MVGQTVSNYQILAKLGEGGMGIVFKALDVRLNRFLALKFLSPELVTEDRKRRFFQEARAASALNHPGIVHIYDIGEWEGADFIAMEYVEGADLHQILRKGPLPVDEALRYAIQIADAMAIAHAAGIVHRDLKPGNVMVTPRGLVKILDFGLAKLNEDAVHSEESETRTLAGAVLGSPAYMSPEQALAKPVDARSDIFAFGLVFYEMLTGRRAFAGGNSVDLISAILHADPQQPSMLNPSVGRELDRVVARCLRKDPERRLQSMKEIRIVLEDLRSESSSPGIVAAVRKRSWIRGAILAAGLICAVAGAFLLLWLRRPDTTGPPQITRLTTEAGLCIDPAISLDGKLLAYASDSSGEGHLDIWVKQIGGGNPIRLTRDPADDTEPAFSPDGTQIAFHSGREGGGIYVVPALGGQERRLVDGGRRPQFSPDGTKIAYWTGAAHPFPLRRGIGQLFVVDLATSVSRQIRPDFAAAVDPVWSPDGGRLLFVGLKDALDFDTYDWWITPIEGGNAVKCPMLTGPYSFNPFAWRGNHVYFAREDDEGQSIGEVALNARTGKPAGAPRRLTTRATVEDSPSVSANGLLVFASDNGHSDIYSVPLDANRGTVNGALQRLTKDLSLKTVRSVSGDGRRLVFTSDRTGVLEVWGKDLETGQERALTSGGGAKAQPMISFDGIQVAWKDQDIAKRAIFVTPFRGGVAKKICDDCGGVGAWSPDGRFLIYRRLSPRAPLTLLETATGSRLEYLKSAERDLVASSFSNDGKWLAFMAHRNTREFAVHLAPFSPERPPPESDWVKVLESPQADPNPRWSPDGGLLYFSSERDGYSCIWAQRLDPATKRARGEPFAVRHFHLPSLPMVAPSFWYPIALARDKVVVSLEERSGGIWMLNLRQ